MEQVLHWFSEYGYWILLVGLFLEYLFLPFPGATVMGFSGVLSYQGSLKYIWCILLAGLGTSIGMSITYFIGKKLGAPFFEKYGSRFFMGPKRQEKVRAWYQRFGSKIVFISFFIPGIRHFTGYFSGVMKLNIKLFLIYTWTGAFLWVTTYVSLGYFLGPNWEHIVNTFKAYLLPICLIALVIIGLYVYWQWFRYTAKKQN